MVNYANNKQYTLTGVNFDKGPESPFDNPEFASYKEYFSKKYNVHIKYKDQFLVKAINKMVVTTGERKKEVVENEVHLVPELLIATGMTDD